MPSALSLPPIYAILDVDVALARGLEPVEVFDAWLGAGITLIQLRAKSWPSGRFLELAGELGARASSAGAVFLVNDRADIARLSGAAGVHVGQHDLTPADARRIVGAGAIVGLSTHEDEQVTAAIDQPIDYLAIGPVFGTSTKPRPDPVVGLEGVRRAAAIARASRLPLVAIGGITLERASLVLAAGASSVAVISNLLVQDPATRAREFRAAVARFLKIPGFLRNPVSFAVPARRLDGASVASAIRRELLPEVQAFTARAGRRPALTIVLVGDDPASHVYVSAKERAARETELDVTVRRLPADTRLDALIELIEALNANPSCDGILVQAPLPAAMGKSAAQRVFDAIDPAKDVDGFHPLNVGLLVQGRATLAPCTPSGILELLTREAIDIAGKHAVVIGRSEIVGKPIALLLLQRNATVTICHSRTADLAAVTRHGDILVAALGRPGFVTPEMVKPGAAVIDVGTTPMTDRALVANIFGEASARLAAFDRKGSTVVGDVHPAVAGVAGALSPVPGGVGPLTIALLLKNTLTAAVTRASKSRQPK